MKRFFESFNDLIFSIFEIFERAKRIDSHKLSGFLEKEAFQKYDGDVHKLREDVLLGEMRQLQENLFSLYKSISSNNNLDVENENINLKEFITTFDRVLRYIASLMNDIKLGENSASLFQDRFMTIKTQVKVLLGFLRNLEEMFFDDDEYYDLEGRLSRLYAIVSELLLTLNISALDSYSGLFDLIDLFSSHLKAANDVKEQTNSFTKRLDHLKIQRNSKEKQLLEMQSQIKIEVSFEEVQTQELNSIRKKIEKIEDESFLFLVRLKDVLVELADLNSDYDFLAFTKEVEQYQSNSLIFLERNVFEKFGPKLQEISERIEYGVIQDVSDKKFCFLDLFSFWDKGHLEQLYLRYKEVLEEQRKNPLQRLQHPQELKLDDLRYRIEHYQSQEELLFSKKEKSRAEEGKHIGRALHVKEQIEQEWKKHFDKEIEVIFNRA
ncbi:hypothetical protein HOC01_06785 [archaeon]|jgi:hypothetical protein|nr:hypothetical protein [archaeon]MBT6697457.1 hypothetical protein [archaeon]